MTGGDVERRGFGQRSAFGEIWLAMQLRGRWSVRVGMVLIRKMVSVACLLWAGVFAAHLVRPAHGSSFTAFAEDEDVCRHAGSEAIGAATGPSAAARYDFAYRRCMAMHGRRRLLGAYAEGAPPDGGYAAGRSYGGEFPDAFYSIPYATPGYGYDGFSY